MELIKFRDEKSIVIDLETTDPDLKAKGSGVRTNGEIVGVGIKVGDWKKYIPLRHRDDGVMHPMNQDEDKVFSWLAEESKDYKGETIGTNLIYDLDYLASKGVSFRNSKIIDIQTAEPLLNDTRYSYSLDAIAKARFGEQKVYGHMKEKYGDNFIKNIAECSIHDTEKYVFGDLDLPEKIWTQQKPELEKQDLWELFELERKLFPMLLYMKRIGVRVDLERAEEVGKIFLQRRDEHLREIKRIGNINGPFNIDSSKEKAKLLDDCGVKYTRKPPTELMVQKGLAAGLEREEIIGNPYLAKDALVAIPGDHPIVQHLIECKQYQHAYNTFIKGYIMGGHVNGRIHCQFNQLKGDEGGTISGRFSSSKPNLQNIPSPEEPNDRGSLVRSIFIPEEGELWWTRDWSQIEYRLLVHYAEKTKCKGGYEAAEMYRNDPATDFHAMVMAMTNRPRKPTKTINFGIVYGMGLAALARKLSMARYEAKEFVGHYHEQVPFVPALFKKCATIAEMRGNIFTLLKRKRRWDMWCKKAKRGFSKAFPRDEAIEVYGEGNITRAFTHKALNALLQGGAADLMKLAMVQLWESGLAEATKINLTVHDELNGSIPRTKEGKEAVDEVTHIMETCYSLNVPLVAEGDVGNNWYEAK